MRSRKLYPDKRGCHQQSGFRGAAASGTAGTAKLPVIPADSGRRIPRTEDFYQLLSEPQISAFAGKNVEPLTKEETGAVVDKTKALMLHRIGDMARLQTDAIIISSCLGVVWVGLIGTYKMIVNSVSGYVNLIFNSVISSFGNLIATESREKQFQLFLVYRFFRNLDIRIFGCRIFSCSCLLSWSCMSERIGCWQLRLSPGI